MNRWLGRSIALWLPVAALTLGGCAERKISSQGTSEAEGPKLDLSLLGKDRKVTLQAMRQRYPALGKALGPHTLTASSTLTSKVKGTPDKEVRQTIQLAMNSKGHYAAEKHTDPHYGDEAIWLDGWLYRRNRHSKYVQRRPESAAEPAAIASSIGLLLPAYVDLLQRFLALGKAEETTLSGRKAIKLKLTLAPKPAPAAPQKAPARGWRRHIVVRKLAGEVVLCKKSGAVLQATLDASWDFHPPAPKRAATGIPTEVDRNTIGKMTLSMKQSVKLGKPATIQAPGPDDLLPHDQIKRRRLELERQILTGERPLPKSMRRRTEQQGGKRGKSSR